MPDLSVAVGQSLEEDSFTAGKEAAEQSREKLGGSPDVLIVFASPRFDHRPLLEGISSVTPDTPMVGGTTAGEISTAGFATQSVVILAMASHSLRFITGLGQHLINREYACSEALVDDLRRKTSLEDALSLLVFPNGLGGDGVKIIEGLYHVLGKDFEIIGGCLGDDAKFENTFQFYNGKVYRDSMPGLLILGKEGFLTGIGVRSGFESIGNRFYCTESAGNVVIKFDDEPALELYKKFLGEERSKRLPGICPDYPFGLIDDRVSISGKEYFQLRAGMSVDHENNTITLAGSIPEGSALTLTTASRGDIINGARLAALQARACLMGAKPEAILMFSCIGRKDVLGRRTSEEIDAVRQVLGQDVPIAGFYTYGEIGPTDKMTPHLATAKFHNETVVLWALGRKNSHSNTNSE